MIGMRVRDYGAVDRFGRIDIEVAGGAVEPGLAKLDHSLTMVTRIC
jgi:hypothetical protein